MPQHFRHCEQEISPPGGQMDAFSKMNFYTLLRNAKTRQLHTKPASWQFNYRGPGLICLLEEPR